MTLDGGVRWRLDGVVMDAILQPEALLSLLMLTTLEIVLGIDNIVFIAIMVERVEESKRAFAYRVGLAGALITRLLLLFMLSWILGLTKPLFMLLGQEISGRDLVMALGGLFLLFKSASEIFHKVESHGEEKAAAGGRAARCNGGRGPS